MSKKNKQENQGMPHSNLPPVLDTFVVDGHEIEIRYHGTWADLCRNYVKRLQQDTLSPPSPNDMTK